jgi:Mrp family chromosome partitioning ATPase
VLDTNVERLTLLPAGRCSPRAAELLASARMETVVAALTARFPDCIIVFDAPPLLVTTEARVLATYMGQIVVVVAAESTRRTDVNQALATLERCRTVYTMLNKAVASGGAGYGYYSRCEPG